MFVQPTELFFYISCDVQQLYCMFMYIKDWSGIVREPRYLISDCSGKSMKMWLKIMDQWPIFLIPINGNCMSSRLFLKLFTFQLKQI